MRQWILYHQEQNGREFEPQTTYQVYSYSKLQIFLCIKCMHVLMRDESESLINMTLYIQYNYILYIHNYAYNNMSVQCHVALGR